LGNPWLWTRKLSHCHGIEMLLHGFCTSQEGRFSGECKLAVRAADVVLYIYVISAAVDGLLTRKVHRSSRGNTVSSSHIS
jgi:hypothetical protein